MQHEGLNIAFLTHFAELSSDDDSMRNHTESLAQRYRDAQENYYYLVLDKCIFLLIICDTLRPFAGIQLKLTHTPSKG